MERLVVIGLVGLLCLQYACSAAEPGDLRERLQAGGAGANAALGEILASPGSVDPIALLVASGIAVDQRPINDAGFLFYLGQLRARADIDVFPPVGTGGDSPSVLVAALHSQIGQVINPALLRDPKAHADLIARVRAVQPNYGREYTPTWQFTKRPTPAEGRAKFDEVRTSLLEYLTKMQTLLDDDVAHEALIVVQECNLADAPAPDCRWRIEAAMQRIRDAAIRLGIEGLLSQ